MTKHIYHDKIYLDHDLFSSYRRKKKCIRIVFRKDLYGDVRFTVVLRKLTKNNEKYRKISKNIEKSMIPLKMLRISWLCPRRAIVLTKSWISKKNAISTFHPPNRPKCCLSFFLFNFFLIKNLFNSVKKIIFWSKQIILWSKQFFFVKININFWKRFFFHEKKIVFHEKSSFFGPPDRKKIVLF